MSDPKRWRDTEDVELAALLGALAKVEPSASVREAVWAKIAPTLPPGPGSASGGGSASRAPAAGTGGAAPSGVLAKALGALAVLAGGGAAIWLIATPPGDRPAPAVQATVSSPSPAEPPAAEPGPAFEAPSSAASAVPVPPPTPAPIAKRAPPAVRDAAAAAEGSAARADRLREEAEGVKRARARLREGNPAAALAELDRLGRLVPAGPLEEEREVLTIEALAASGSRDVARRRAERFLFERPRSVHADRVRVFAAP